MGRCAVLQGIEQVAEFGLRVFGADFEGCKNLALHVGAVNTHRAATQLPAIKHHVVGFGCAAARVGVHVVFVTVFGGGEGVVYGSPALLVFVKLKHGEINHPQRSPAVFKQAGFFAKLAMANFQAQCTDGVINDFCLVCAEENQVAILCASALKNGGKCSVVQVFDDGALQTVAAFVFFIDLNPRQPFGTVDFDKLGVAVDFATANGCTAWHAQCYHAPARGGRGRKHFEIDIGHGVSQLGEGEFDAQIGFVRAVQVHGLGVGHDGELAQIHIHGVFKDGANHALEQAADFFFAKEGSFNINLGKFWLAVGTQIFVAEAFGDLVVAVVASNHQHLLVDLGRLGQGEEMPVVYAAGHEVVARAFGGGFAQHGGFNVDKAIGIEEFANFHRHFVAQHEVALHIRAAQVKHAVGEAGGFAQMLVIKLEGWRNRWVKHYQLVAKNLDFARGNGIVGGAFRAGAYQAFDLDAELVTQVFGQFEHFGAVGVAHDLHEAFAVAQIDKDNAAVVAPAIDPAAQGNGLPHQGFSNLTAINRTHRHLRVASFCAKAHVFWIVV